MVLHRGVSGDEFRACAVQAIDDTGLQLFSIVYECNAMHIANNYYSPLRNHELTSALPSYRSRGIRGESYLRGEMNLKI